MTEPSAGGLRSVMGDGTERVRGRDARTTNVAAGRALADAVRTTLGPVSADKMLVGSDGRVVVTNDGESILERLSIDHPTASAIADVAASQDEAVGDGTTATVILTGELLDRAESLLEDGVHATTVAAGYRIGADRAAEALRSAAIELPPEDDRLVDVARTAVTNRWTDAEARFLAELTVEAVRAVAEGGRLRPERLTRSAVPGGELRDSTVVEGLVIDTERSSTSPASPAATPPRRVEDAEIVLIDDRLTIESPDGTGAVRPTTPDQREAFLEYEEDVYASQLEGIVEAGADVVFCQKAIDDRVKSLLAREGILPVERTRQDEIYKLARATGASFVPSVSELSPLDAGRAGLVERRTAAGRELTVVTDLPASDQASILLRGGTDHVADELERIVDDCLAVVGRTIEERTVLPGGGAPEMYAARAVADHARAVPGREQLAVEAFAGALEAIPGTLATNAGMDPIDALVELRRRHEEGDAAAGIDAERGVVADMAAADVLEPLAVKRRTIDGAAEIAATIVRIDDVVAATDGSAGGDGGDHGHDHDHGHGGLHAATEGYPWAVGHSMGH